MSSPKLVKNKSKAGSGAYSYNYASLADIVEQGIEIPEMRIKPIFTPDGTKYIGDYFEYKDKDGNWQLGSRIIEAELKGQNAQQSRGSSETYARRYTTLMACQLAGQDDKSVEGAQNSKSAPKSTGGGNRIDFQDVRDECALIDDLESLQDLYKRLQVDKMSEAQQKYINSIINKRKRELEK